MSYVFAPGALKDWIAWELLGDVCRLSERDDGSVHLEQTSPLARRGAILLRARIAAAESARAEEWVFISDDPSVRLNGIAIAGGLALLRNHDEISLKPGLRIYFSQERLPAVTTFPHTDAVACPRCHTPVEFGAAAVCCPDCGVWYHETAELSCWTHAPHCTTCECPTDLTQGFRWAPLSVDGVRP